MVEFYLTLLCFCVYMTVYNDNIQVKQKEIAWTKKIVCLLHFGSSRTVLNHHFLALEQIDLYVFL